MPLIRSKSKKALSKNIETEMNSGKPKDQSIAIAYSVQRQAKKKKMAHGGAVEQPKMGPMDSADSMSDESIVDKIMNRRRAKMMADGGMVDIEENGTEEPSILEEQNEDAILKENYDSDLEDVTQPMDSNEHGDEIPSDEHDMIDRIRARIRAKRGL